MAAPQNPSPFLASGSLEYGGGGSFSLGTTGGDKSARKYVKVRKHGRTIRMSLMPAQMRGAVKNVAVISSFLLAAGRSWSQFCMFFLNAFPVFICKAMEPPRMNAREEWSSDIEVDIEVDGRCEVDIMANSERTSTSSSKVVNSFITASSFEDVSLSKDASS
ncbi:hypothetical protein Gohar_019994 [Gossypium harknessii]|uniref:Uncharacterized protein n=1 Tax=Gossypium harknessii TaxID=34285 RepID=A0A7J9HWC5_9ROSI|nr:hypothetical protein [Gossypium harknessii]